ncbi:amidohydrolase family protein [Spirosoma arcticum]
MEPMKIVGLEEHVAVKPLLDAWAKVPGMPQIPELGYGNEPLALRLRDIGDRRLAEMDDLGVDVQVLSLSTPGVQILAPADSVSVARESNDALAEIVSSNPARFQALAALPTPSPEAAADELERVITQLGFRGAMIFGRTGDQNADAPQFDPIYATAARLRAPLYLHPQTPLPAVMQAYYTGYGQQVDYMFGTFGLGWYYDNGVQLLRLIFSGVFDRHPDLQVIVGHWGELVLFYLEHIATMQTTGLHLERPLADYFRQNIWVTGSGLLSERYLRWTAEVVGVDRMMYSTDYPFTYQTPYPPLDTSRGRGRQFLEQAPLTEAEKAAFGSGNWERLTGHLAMPTRS